MSDRRSRQGKQKSLQQAQANAEQKKHNLEHTKYLADKTESRAEAHLMRMRSGYAEGAKLFFDSFKTQATLTTGSILVIAALSEGLLSENTLYRPLLWFSYGALLFSMLAALRTMEIVNVLVFETLTNEEQPQPTLPEDEAEEQERVEEETRKSEALRKQSERSLATLKWRSRWASWSFYAGIGAFALFVIVPPLVEFLGAK